MTRKIITKFDKFINFITLILLVSGAVALHTLTSLTFKSYYGDPWGYISFALPVMSEAYLIMIQIADEMYNFTLIFIFFILTAGLAGATWFVKNLIIQRIEATLETRNVNP